MKAVPFAKMPEIETVKTNLPWVEKYRPIGLDELISHVDIIKTLDKLIKENQLPHLLFYGPPGTGKTSTILACAKKMYSPSQLNSMVLELNASDDRGIGIVRGVIMNFASTRTILKGGFKLIILDEADAMTSDAQNALRRIIEKYTENVRFCIICNYLSKIIPALQSRCTRFRFAPLVNEQILPRLNYVIEKENVKATDDGKQALLTLAKGDMRKVLNILQSAHMACDKVDEENVYLCTGHPLKSDIVHIVNWMLNEDFAAAYSQILELKTVKGLALEDILTEIHSYVHRIEFPAEIKIHLLIKMAEVEHRLSVGTSEKVQLSSLISAFQGVIHKEHLLRTHHWQYHNNQLYVCRYCGQSMRLRQNLRRLLVCRHPEMRSEWDSVGGLDVMLVTRMMEEESSWGAVGEMVSMADATASGAAPFVIQTRGTTVDVAESHTFILQDGTIIQQDQSSSKHPPLCPWS